MRKNIQEHYCMVFFLFGVPTIAKDSCQRRLGKWCWHVAAWSVSAPPKQLDSTILLCPKWLSLSDRKLLRWQNCFQQDPPLLPVQRNRRSVQLSVLNTWNKVLKKFYVQWHETFHRMPYRFCWSSTLRYVKWSGPQTWQREIHIHRFPTNTRITRIQ